MILRARSGGCRRRMAMGAGYDIASFAPDALVGSRQADAQGAQSLRAEVVIGDRAGFGSTVKPRGNLEHVLGKSGLDGRAIQLAQNAAPEPAGELVFHCSVVEPRPDDGEDRGKGDKLALIGQIDDPIDVVLPEELRRSLETFFDRSTVFQVASRGATDAWPGLRTAPTPCARRQFRPHGSRPRAGGRWLGAQLPRPGP